MWPVHLIDQIPSSKQQDLQLTQVTEPYVRSHILIDASWTEARKLSSHLLHRVATARTCWIWLKNLSTSLRCL